LNPLYFEDYGPETRFRTLARTVTETDLVNFVGVSGLFESLFIDAESLRDSPYTGRLVPGALTYAMAEGLVVQTGVLHERGLAFLGAEIRVEAPVYVGDTLHVDVEVVESRPTRRADRGLVLTRHVVSNQRDEPVMVYTATRLIRRREEPRH
jgi:acyl dehydratase